PAPFDNPPPMFDICRHCFRSPFQGYIYHNTDSRGVAPCYDQSRPFRALIPRPAGARRFPFSRKSRVCRFPLSRE
ncbi:MAG: hypothetical protein ACR2P4_09720, partial [Gammaproteobacteria bacterium]